MTGQKRRVAKWSMETPVSVGWMDQFHYFVRLYYLIQDIPGDIVECGLGDGDTFVMLGYLAGSGLYPVH